MFIGDRFIYAEGELFEPATAEDYSVFQTEGKRQVSLFIKHYNREVHPPMVRMSQNFDLFQRESMLSFL
jgi:hypothetical protein